ncbi:MAG: ATPase, T2SS/T4P/T4SS family [Gammaproteobacteria bacterium]|nr:ATPase, T2SS/T4P/T4SS family [Gammaproteobacteria bacterium]
MDDTLNATAALLVQHKLLSQETAWQCQKSAILNACRFLPYVVQHSQICPQTIAQLLADHFGLRVVDLSQIDPSTLPKTSHTTSILRQHHALPIAHQDNQLYVAIDDPHQHDALNAIQFLTGLHIIPMIAATTQLSQMIEEILRNDDHQDLTDYLSMQSHIIELSLDSTLNVEDEAPIVAFVQRVFQQAITRDATDLHFEAYADFYRIRYRKDGQLYLLASPPQAVASRIASRLKIMANLDIAERRRPQDGRFTMAHAPNQTIDCRISTCPTITGEKIAIRILRSHLCQPDIAQLGFSDRDKTCVHQAMQRTQGLILVTGPTGSGKTVTLYAALQYLNTGDKNISTAEDPVEIKHAGINQVQINPKIGLDFSNALRSFLRQDPDIIMLGEIRDFDTADIAIKAAHTGHLVLSTLHTNSCAETVIRLKQLGISPFLLLSSVSLIIAQRLIRMLCPHCKIPTTTGSYRAKGCHRCHDGYHGRCAIFEVMPISNALRALLIQPKITAEKLKVQAHKEGMLSLHDAGLIQVQQGVTTVEEINRIT